MNCRSSSNPKPKNRVRNPKEKENSNKHQPSTITSKKSIVTSVTNTSNSRKPLTDLKSSNQFHGYLANTESSSNKTTTKLSSKKSTCTNSSVAEKITGPVISKSNNSNATSVSKSSKNTLIKSNSATNIASNNDIKSTSSTTNKYTDTRQTQTTMKKTINNCKNVNNCGNVRRISNSTTRNTTTASKINTKIIPSNSNVDIKSKRIKDKSIINKFKPAANSTIIRKSSNSTIKGSSKNMAVIATKNVSNKDTALYNITDTMNNKCKCETITHNFGSDNISTQVSTFSNNNIKVLPINISSAQKMSNTAQKCCTSTKNISKVPTNELNTTFNKNEPDKKTSISNNISNILDNYNVLRSKNISKHLDSIYDAFYKNRKVTTIPSSISNNSSEYSSIIRNNTNSSSNTENSCSKAKNLNLPKDSNILKNNTTINIDVQKVNIDIKKSISETSSPVLVDDIEANQIETLYTPIIAEIEAGNLKLNNLLTNNTEILQTDAIVSTQLSKSTNEKCTFVITESESDPATSTPITKREIGSSCIEEKEVPKKSTNISEFHRTEIAIECSPIVIKRENTFVITINNNILENPVLNNSDILCSSKNCTSTETEPITEKSNNVTYVEKINCNDMTYCEKSEYINEKEDSNINIIKLNLVVNETENFLNTTTTKIDLDQVECANTMENSDSGCTTFDSHCFTTDENCNRSCKTISTLDNLLSPKTDPKISKNESCTNTTIPEDTFLEKSIIIYSTKNLETIKEETEEEYFLEDSVIDDSNNFWLQFKAIKHYLNSSLDISNTQIYSNTNITGNLQQNKIYDRIPKKKTFKKEILKPSEALGIVNLDSNTHKVHHLLLYPDSLLHDIMSQVISREIKNKLNFGFLGENIEHCELRSILVNWLVKLHQYLAPDTCVLFLTIRLFDRILANYEILESNYQMYALATYWIVLKDNCGDIITAPDILKLCNEKYSLDRFLIMEKNVLLYLDYNINIDEPMIFVYYFIYIMQLSNSNIISFCANYFLEILSLAHHCNCYPLSLQAASAVSLTLKLFNIVDSHWLMIKNHCGYYEQKEMLILHKLIIEQVLLMNNDKYPYRESYKRFSNEKYERVSLKVATKIAEYI